MHDNFFLGVITNSDHKTFVSPAIRQEDPTISTQGKHQVINVELPSMKAKRNNCGAILAKCFLSR